MRIFAFRNRITRYDFLRYSQIVGVLARYGLGDIIGRIRIGYNVRWCTKRVRGSTQTCAEICTPERLRLAFEELGPTFIKFGQILSCRPDLLRPEFIRELSKLQDSVPAFPYVEAKAAIEGGIGRPLCELFEWMSSEPVAAGSLAQVYRARTCSGEEVAVKVQRPGIEAIIDPDIRILYKLATLVKRRFTELRQYEPTRIVDEFARSIRKELDFVREGRNTDRFRQYFAGDISVHIPRVYWTHTAPKVLTIEYIRGIKISDTKQIEVAGLDRRKIAINGANLILKEVFQHHFFHADPHPGNLFVLEDNVIAPVDFGMTGSIDDELAERVSLLVSAVVRKDIDRTINTLLALGSTEEPLDRKVLKADLADLFDEYYGVSLKEVSIKKFLDQLMALIREHKLRPPSELVMMARALLLSEGVGRELYPQFNIIEHMKPYAHKVLTQHFDPARELQELTVAGKESIKLAKQLPGDMIEILSKLKKADFGTSAEQGRVERFSTQISNSSNRLSLAIMAGAFIVGSSIVFQAGLGPTLFGYSFLGLMGFLLASILGVCLLVGILCSKTR